MAAASVLIVAVELALLGSAASGVETVPENTAAPTISPVAPIEGGTETATQGTWNGGPTSFTYSWYRCAGTEACVSIPLATSKTYVPIGADVNHTLRVMVTASNTAGTGSALSAATSAVKVPAPPYSWSSCKNTGTGKYTNSSCAVFGSGGFEWTKVKEATPTTFSASGTSTFVLKFRLFHISATINCKSQSSAGTLENPSGGKTAVVTSASFKLSGCTFSEPAGCTVPGETLTFKTLHGATTESKEGRRVVLEPEAETILIFEIGGEVCALAGTYKLPGSLGAIDNPTTSSLEFTSGSSSLAPFAGETTPTTLEGTSKIQTTAGEALKLTP